MACTEGSRQLILCLVRHLRSGAMEFTLATLSGLIGNVLAVVIVYYLIDQRIKKRDEAAAARERTRDEARRASDTRNVLLATLLQQLPPLMQRITETQREAFSRGILVVGAMSEKSELLAAETTNMLRHIANVHLDTVATVRCFLGRNSEMEAKANLTNALAVAALQLSRSGMCEERVLEHVDRHLSHIRSHSDPKARSKSHIVRITQLLEDIRLKCGEFGRSDTSQKVALLGALCEAVGHNSNLLFEDLIEGLRQQSERIGWKAEEPEQMTERPGEA